ncbi:hypothetical protein QH639_13060 [Lysinibacillus sp. 1 U-2021]|uniref:hypothetical protein n=1 Tax=unclassified Lysinibacillus TaxID=2636778 RepID=UPI001EDBEBCF|nr:MULTISPECIES: hypothetical protein [unclassified Lysinibacillus]UKJ47115.1 hypothetical protein L6W14_08725 [Lysinibacillus sp. ACHW1.5]WGT36779.1 hypothetical protein QH639_13060 [Lysinibacillus sp. 1 U-2021]
MKLVNVVLTGLLISGLLIGCTEEEKTKGEQAKTEETTIKQVAAVNPRKTGMMYQPLKASITMRLNQRWKHGLPIMPKILTKQQT